MSHKAKICLSTAAYPPVVGGLGVAAKRLTGNLAAAGYLVHVVTPCDKPGAQGELQRSKESGIIVHRLFHDFRHAQAAFAYRQLVRELDNEVDFDLFHGFFLTAVYPCVTAAERNRYRPVIASIRGTDVAMLINVPGLRRTILKGLRKATWVTSVNQLYLDRVAEEVAINGRSSIIHNGIQLPSETWRLDDTNRGVVGTVGQFRRVKDIPLLIRGYHYIPAQLRHRLLLAGYWDDPDPQEEAWAKTLIEEFDLTEQVEVTGRFAQKEVFRYLQKMHVYVQSSAYEGMPNALLEAASLGVPLVATAVGGMREILDDERNALLVPHGDSSQLGAAITRVLRDPDLTCQLSQGARRLAEYFSPEREREQWLALYTRLLNANLPEKIQ